MNDDVIKVCRVLLSPKKNITRQDLEEVVNSALMIPEYKGLNKKELIRELESIFSISIGSASVLWNTRPSPWIKSKKSEIKFKFWNRYSEFLRLERKIPNSVLYQLDSITDDVLDGLFNPDLSLTINKRGLVVGQVQSGKTSNYTGLICKAADAGFKIIIILAGIHNSLRSQTQLRLDEGFLGFDTQFQRALNLGDIRIGVAAYADPTDRAAHSLTTSANNGDFSAPRANGLGINFNTDEPIIAVVKKNSSILLRLISWLEANASRNADNGLSIKNKSLLLIDDEADYASINVNPLGDERTAINRQILRILGLFEKTGYVGYTATPFANIFIPINSDDLFPKDFIFNIPAPSNYIGPEKLFNTQNFDNYRDSDTVLPLFNCVSDYHAFFPQCHKKNDPLPNTIPESLKLAVRCFILTCAIRRYRGQGTSHNSMLIHVTRFVRWQNRIAELVGQQLHYYKNAIDLNISDVIEEFRKTFEENVDLGNKHDYLPFTTVSSLILESDFDIEASVHEWDDILPYLNGAVQKVTVKEINGGSQEVLNYVDNQAEGLSVIAIGGNKLSRGLTLEGLSVSYYLRASKMYDTLMQMGRWFGYRPGYTDLCRLFSSSEINEWFCHITLASEELRQEFDIMTKVAGSTPENYALRVRSAPGVLQISASNKIRSTVQFQISWSERLVESYQLSLDNMILQNNLSVVNQLIDSLGKNFQLKHNNYLWLGVPFDLIRPFMLRFRVAKSLVRAQPANLLRFIEAQLNNGELTEWNVALMSKSSPQESYSLETGFGSLVVGLYTRTNDSERSEPNDPSFFIKRNHIISPKDEFIDLTEDEYRRAVEETRKIKGEDYKYPFPSGAVVRKMIRNPQNPLLLLYYIDPASSLSPDIVVGVPTIVGFAISFPRSNYNIPVGWVINSCLQDKFREDEDFEVYDEE